MSKQHKAPQKGFEFGQGEKQKAKTGNFPPKDKGMEKKRKEHK